MNIRMWAKALSTIPEIKKEEWDRLDIVSRWLIATRSAVVLVTFIACAIAGLLALRDGSFVFLPWLVVTLGLFIAHGSNNIFNDYTDYVRGVDEDNYFRSMYGPQPLTHGFMTKRQQLTLFASSGILAVLAGVYALFYTGFDPLVIGLFAVGAFFVLAYTWPLKYIALGELTVLLVWGPLIVGGVYYVLHGSWDWNVAVASLPFSLAVTVVIFGKHIDKISIDRQKHIHTLPVVIGEKAARLLAILLTAAIYILLVYLMVIRYFTPVMLLCFLALKPAWMTVKVLSRPKPAAPPENYPGRWPLWFASVGFYHNRIFGGWFLLSLVLEVILRLLVFPYFNILY